ncbi:flagellar biosynthetic protein FliR [Jannaschia sp. LMIT008]|uniref:flagellar biosynthetic protein FliR n=1 Tax=Jannaschia maritima TaxID=3032585 RepID=UPI0028119BCF|nr:flagellar biosynthetic protein FliR [Jannaschia sp. LMIT008]
MTGLGPILDALGLPPVAVAVVFFRVTGLMFFLPAFGERMIPARVRLGATFALTAMIAPLMPAAALPADVTPALILTEATTGAALGAVLKFMTHALLMTGAIAAQATSLSQLFGVQSMDPSSAMGNVLHLGGLALLMASGLHLMVVDLMIRSWDVFPAGFLLPGADVAQWGLERVGAAFALALGLSAPFVIASVLYNLALGVINKAMPQLMVALVGAPLITGLSLALLAATAAIILTVWRERFLATILDPIGIL